MCTGFKCHRNVQGHFRLSYFFRLNRHRSSIVSFRGQRVYISELGAQPSVSLTAATDGSDEDDLMSGTSTFLMILMLSILVLLLSLLSL